MKLNNDEKRDIIITHYEYPINKVESFEDKRYKTSSETSTSCIDNITCYIMTNKNLIKDIKFSGVGCAIATSSTDIMIETIKNKTIPEAIKLIKQYLSMIEGKTTPNKNFKDLIVFETIYKQENRKHCASIGIKAILKGLETKN